MGTSLSVNTQSNPIANSNNPLSNEALKHSKSYSDLLEAYVNLAQNNIKLKMWFKILFFAVTMLTLIAIVVAFCLCLWYACKKFSKFDNLNDVSVEAIASIVTVLFPSITSLIVAFVKIPEIIAKYLFNIKEDSFMDSIIKNIQDYDKSMFSLEKKAEEVLKNNRNQPIETQDIDIEEPITQNTG